VERLVVLGSGDEITEADVRAELSRPVRFATETGAAGADAQSGESEENGEGGGRAQSGEPAGRGGRREVADDAPGSAGIVRPLSEVLRDAERRALVRALEHAGGNRSAAARLLGVSRSTLYAKLEEHGVLAAESGKLDRSP
jgi:DNA-binding NtrC family response regulator